MTIDTYRHHGMDRGVAVYDPLEMRDHESVADTIERLIGSRPWEAEDGTLSVECDTPREARAVVAYLKAYYIERLAPA